MLDELLEDEHHELRDTEDQAGAPQQAPTLSPSEEVAIHAATTSRRRIEWLMAGDKAPDTDALLAEVIQGPALHRRAACRGMGTDSFFPGRGQHVGPAMTVCEGCSVRSECLSAALDAGDRHGIWGGLSEKARRILRRRAA